MINVLLKDDLYNTVDPESDIVKAKMAIWNNPIGILKVVPKVS